MYNIDIKSINDEMLLETHGLITFISTRNQGLPSVHPSHLDQ